MEMTLAKERHTPYCAGMLTDATTTKFWARVNKNGPLPEIDPELGPCWLWERPQKSGYGLLYFADSYALRKAGEKYCELAHRYSWALHYGEPIPSRVDHRCQVEACVRGTHLREATNKQNMEYRVGLNANNTSGHRGATYDASRGLWAAQVKHEGQTIHLGRWPSEELAGAAAYGARKALFTFNGPGD